MIQALRTRWYLTAAVVLAAVAAAAAVKLTSRSVPTGAATVQIMVDSPQSALADLKQDPLPLVSRATVFSQLMTSGAVLNDIAQAAGVPPRAVTAEGPYSGAGQALDVPTPSPARGVQILSSTALYRVTFVPDATIPLVTVSVQGPNPAAAGKLANAVAPGVRSWLNALQGGVPAYHRVIIRQLGDAQAGTINSSSSTTLAGVGAAAVLLIGLLVIIAVEERRTRRLAPRTGTAGSAGSASLAGSNLENGHHHELEPNGTQVRISGAGLGRISRSRRIASRRPSPDGAAIDLARQQNGPQVQEKSGDESEQPAGAT